MRPAFAAAVLAAAVLPAGCGREPAAPGALSAEDERKLDEAAAMLDANAVDPDAVAANTTTANESESDD